ncbi:MAG TPA: hypothetical protein VEQ17_02485, partial [Steroidobacteraceae bacterium]|nr:hypothetical protein [Steroidobacteraceae bacterium]
MGFDPGQLLEGKLAQLRELAPETWQLLQDQPDLLEQARNVLLGSEFVLQSLCQDPAALPELWRGGRLSGPTSQEDYAAQAAALQSRALPTEAEAARAL